MANREHLEILLRGVEEWNDWRKNHSGIRANLEGADLRDANLERAKLQDANLEGADLRDANLHDFWSSARSATSIGLGSSPTEKNELG